MYQKRSLSFLVCFLFSPTHPEPRENFEVPIVPPLPEDFNFVG